MVSAIFLALELRLWNAMSAFTLERSPTTVVSVTFHAKPLGTFGGTWWKNTYDLEFGKHDLSWVFTEIRPLQMWWSQKTHLPWNSGENPCKCDHCNYSKGRNSWDMNEWFAHLLRRIPLLLTKSCEGKVGWNTQKLWFYGWLSWDLPLITYSDAVMGLYNILGGSVWASSDSDVIFFTSAV